MKRRARFGGAVRTATGAAERGYVLLTVVLSLAVVAMLAFMMNREAGQAPGLARAQLEAEQARYLVESALAHATWDANDGTCVNYGLPSTTLAGTGHVYSAVFTPDNGSPVEVTATGTTAGGATRTRTRDNITLIEAPSTTVIQPDGIAGTDTWLYEWQATRSYGSDDRIKVTEGLLSGGNALLRFDIGAIPPAAVITGAVLELYQAHPGSDGAPVDVHRVTVTWTEGVGTGGTGTPNWTERAAGTNWGSAGGDFDGTVVATTSIGSGTTGWFSWDVTSLVTDWFDGTHPNQGMVLKADTLLTASLEFHSSEAATAALRPKLTVTYACECGAGGGAGTVVYRPAAPGKEAHLRGAKNYGATAYTWVDTTAPYHALYEFDLSEFAPGIVVTSATLEIHQSSADAVAAPGDLDVHRVTTPWVEGTGGIPGLTPPDGATWDTRDGTTPWTTAGGDFDAAVIDSAVVDSTGAAWHTWDVGTLVQDWIDGTSPNYGVLLRASSGTIEKLYLDTGEHADASAHPRLSVGYACGCATASIGGNATLQPAAGDSADTFLDAGAPAANHTTWTSMAVSNNGASDKRALVSFDVGGIPPAAVVTSASLELYLTGIASGGTAAVDVHRLTQSWTHDQASWNEHATAAAWAAPGGDFAAPVIATAGINAAAPGVAQWDVTATVADWVAGTAANAGFMLRGVSPVTDAYFASSGESDPSRRPQLVVEYTCPCGVGCTPPDPPGLLMVVVDPASLTTTEISNLALVESWGYAVTVIDEASSQVSFDAALATADVAFVSDDVLSSTVGTKLAGAAIGVVASEVYLSDEHGFSASIHLGVGTTLTITDNTHYVTQPFGLSAVNVLNVSETLADLTGAVSGDIAALGDNTAGPALAALNAGAAMAGGGTTAGRRVQLPWGGNEHDPDNLTPDGLTLFERALAWGAGTGPAWVPPPEYLDTFAHNDCSASDYAGSDGTLDWSAQAWTEIGDSGSSCSGPVKLGAAGPGYAAVIGGAGNGLERAVNLTPFATAFLNLDVARENWNGDGEALSVEVWDVAGGAWIELGRVTGAGTDTAASSLSYNLTPYIAAGAKLRLSGTGLETTGLGEHAHVDDVRITTVPLQGYFYLDRFHARDCVAGDFTRSDGTLDWTGASWTERGESDGACAGDTQVDADLVDPDGGSHRLTLRDSTSGATRAVNLDDMLAARMRFAYRRQAYPPTTHFTVEVNDGIGSGWVVLDTIAGAGTDGSYVAASYDLSAYASAATQVRFHAGGADVGQTLFIDDIRVYDAVGAAACATLYRDEFNTLSYAGNDGSDNWSGNWWELNDDGYINAGDVLISADVGYYQLEMKDNGRAMRRVADLAGAANAVLRFDYRRSGLDSSFDYVAIRASDDGSDFTEIGRISGPGTDGQYSPRSLSLDAYLGGPVTLEFLTSPSNGNLDRTFFDNVEICTQ